jgi:hypothetical protein
MCCVRGGGKDDVIGVRECERFPILASPPSFVPDNAGHWRRSCKAGEHGMDGGSEFHCGGWLDVPALVGMAGVQHGRSSGLDGRCVDPEMRPVCRDLFGLRHGRRGGVFGGHVSPFLVSVSVVKDLMAAACASLLTGCSSAGWQSFTEAARKVPWRVSYEDQAEGVSVGLDSKAGLDVRVDRKSGK